MKLVTIFVIVTSIKCIQSCRTNISKDLSDGKSASLDYKNWKLPPDNEDWMDLVNLLGTRGEKDTAGGATATEKNSLENEKFFPWPGLGAGQNVFNPPPEAKIKKFIGQSSSCLYSYARGNGTDSYTRWYYDIKNDKCKSFTYSGTGGNTNRFLTKWHCDQYCKQPAKALCVPDALFDYFNYLQKPDLDIPK